MPTASFVETNANNPNNMAQEMIFMQKEEFEQLQRTTLSQMKRMLEQELKLGTVEWLDNAQAQGLLKVSKRTLQAWRDKGLLGFSQIGSKIYYSRPEIDRFLLHHAHKSFAK
ncbi:helix-turn-helix domain-containing protein [Hymenobacter humi]|uniref:Helix-turn-helix domain-containing protein n=1 Tax=Hymenobacter humi TaxID=1411620 RepID=A0ABW2U9M7_9BACT